MTATHSTATLNSQISHDITAWIDQWVSKERLPPPETIETLAGDGSPRTFYRLRWPGKSFILLRDPSWNLSKDYAPHQAYLALRKLPVPEFLTVDPQAGFLVMQDLGDDLLQVHVLKVMNEPHQKMRWLQQATVLLAQLHGKAAPVDSRLPASQRRFDSQKYSEELLFTFEHLVKGLLKEPEITDDKKDILRAYTTVLATLGPDVFCHRDYHCRNLLVKDSALYLIDFQDARLGPPHYDLASLVYDAYVPVNDVERRLLIQIYKEELKRFPISAKVNWDQFVEDLEFVAFQRVVKAAGSFASFYTRYQKTTHLPYLRPALEHASVLMERCPRLPTQLKSLFPFSTWLEKLKTQGVIS